MTACHDRSTLVRLLDGELTENRAAQLREHLDGCGACQAELAAWRRLTQQIAAPVPARPFAEQRVVARLAGEAALRPHRARRWLALAAAPALAMAAVLLVLHARSAPDPGTFTARGAAAGHSYERDIDVALYMAGARLARLHDGDVVTGETPYAVSYRNLGAPAYFAVVAVDAAGELHWIAPAYLTARSDPSSLALPRAARDVVLPKAAVLDAPARGPLRVLAIITSHPLHVSEVEALPHPLDARALRRRWPRADIRTLTLDLRSSP